MHEANTWDHAILEVEEASASVWNQKYKNFILSLKIEEGDNIKIIKKKHEGAIWFFSFLHNWYTSKK